MHGHFSQPCRSVNWLTNIRGRDLPCTPVMQAYALYRENGLILLAEPGRLAAVMADDLASDASVVPLTDLRPVRSGGGL